MARRRTASSDSVHLPLQSCLPHETPPHLPATILLVLLVSLGHLLMPGMALDSAAYPDVAAYPEAAAGLEGEQASPVGLGQLVIDSDRLQETIDRLARFSDVAAPAVTRIVYSDEDLEARRYIRSLMTDAGLSVHDDAVGNIFGRWEGTDTRDGAVGTGSHTDAIPYSGKYDGVLGVLGAIEAVRALKSAGFRPLRPIDIVMFTSEEPTRFGYSCLGSRAMAGVSAFKPKLAAAGDAEGRSFAEVAAAAGYNNAMDGFDGVSVAGKYKAFVELHIEQGPLLEEEALAIGIVTAIAAPAQLTVHFSGDGGHAGAQLMYLRNDAGLAASELALAVEAAVLATKSNDTVGTVGVMDIQPGAVNSVPREARLEIDIRDIDGPRRDKVLASVQQSAAEIASRRRVRFNITVVSQDPPATSADSVISAAVSAAEFLRLPYRMMPSRAYHDSLFMARVAPMGMIFIPCRNGVSHRPDEFASKEDMGRGVHVLALTLARLSTAPKHDCCH